MKCNKTDEISDGKMVLNLNGIKNVELSERKLKRSSNIQLKTMKLILRVLKNASNFKTTKFRNYNVNYQSLKVYQARNQDLKEERSGDFFLKDLKTRWKFHTTLDNPGQPSPYFLDNHLTSWLKVEIFDS